MDVHIGEDGKKPIVSNNKVVTSTQGYLLLLMTMRPVGVVPTSNTSCQGGVLLD
jgi:hypothetical protein